MDGSLTRPTGRARDEPRTWDVTHGADSEDLHPPRGVNGRRGGQRVHGGRFKVQLKKSTIIKASLACWRSTSGTYELDVGAGRGRRARMRGEDFGFVFRQFNIFAARTAAETSSLPLLYASGAQLLCSANSPPGVRSTSGLADRADSHPGR